MTTIDKQGVNRYAELKQLTRKVKTLEAIKELEKREAVYLSNMQRVEGQSKGLDAFYLHQIDINHRAANRLYIAFNNL